jgi:Spy/CpxP family protein refolding chaperone
MKTKNLLMTGLFLATSASCFAAPAMAQPMGDCPAMDGKSGGRHTEMRAEHMKQRQQQLHSALKLNPEQEKAWGKYQESFANMQPGERPTADSMAKLSAPERAEQMLDHSRKHQERMTQHVAALKTFYATLTPEQQKTFDAQQMQRGQREQRGPRQPGGKGPGNPPANTPAAN